MGYQNHRQLIMWQKSIELTDLVYDLCLSFPKHELYGLVSQMQRCACSIASNIAEGKGRDSDNEFNHFLKIATGSAWELDTQLEIARRRGYISEEQNIAALDLLEEILKLIYGMRKSLGIF